MRARAKTPVGALFCVLAAALIFISAGAVIAAEPIATLRERLPSVDLTTGEAAPARHERSDVTAVSRLAIIAEAIVAYDLARHVRRRFGGAHIDEVREAIERHRARMDHVFGA